MGKLEIVGGLIDIKNPPEDSHGYYGLVLKPKYMPLWFARIFKNHLRVREGWLNKQRSHFKPKNEWDEIWWFDHSKGRDRSERCEPIFWCKIKSYYKVKVIPNGGSPFTWKTEDPKGSYKVAK